MGATNAKGYGIFSDGLVHRAMYRKHIGEIPAGKYVLHHCDVRSCCNPAHLYVGTQKDNMRDMFVRGRTGNRKGQPAGELHSLAKLSMDEVNDIRTCSGFGYGYSFLARCYGVSSSQIRRIVRGERWRIADASKIQPVA